MPNPLFNASRLASIQVDYGETSEEEYEGFPASAERLVQPTARCQQGQSCFRAASDSGAVCKCMLCMQMEKDIIKKAIEIAISNPFTVNRYFPLCSSEKISINMPKAQDGSRDLLLPSCFYLHSCKLYERSLLHQSVSFSG